MSNIFGVRMFYLHKGASSSLTFHQRCASKESPGALPPRFGAYREYHIFNCMINWCALIISFLQCSRRQRKYRKDKKLVGWWFCNNIELCEGKYCIWNKGIYYIELLTACNLLLFLCCSMHLPSIKYHCLYDAEKWSFDVKQNKQWPM